jgi:hypothetical protein
MYMICHHSTFYIPTFIHHYQRARYTQVSSNYHVPVTRYIKIVVIKVAQFLETTFHPEFPNTSLLEIPPVSLALTTTHCRLSSIADCRKYKMPLVA